ncbi:MAG: DUF4412 domain-containing protein [Armatimonadota bacterium]
MIKKSTKQAMTTLAITIIVILVSASMAFAVEFSANLSQKISNGQKSMSVTGKLYVKGVMQRQDITSPMGKQIAIIRPDKGVMWMIRPSEKAYMEQNIQKMDPKNPPTVESMLKRMPGYKKIGSEKISGFQCDKYKFDDKTRKLSGTVCISPKLKQELKSDVTTPQGKINLILSNIKEGTQNASLFNLPAGYKKVDPQMPGGMGGPGGPPPGPRKAPGGGMPSGFPK